MNAAEIFNSLNEIRKKESGFQEKTMLFKQNFTQSSDQEWVDLFTTHLDSAWMLSEAEKATSQAQLLRIVPNAQIDKYNPELYTKLLPYAKLLYTAEQNGLAEEHAYKLAVVFGTEDEALTYLKTCLQSILPKSLHDACLFTIPEGNYELTIWRKLWIKFVGKPELSQFLPIFSQAAEIEALIKKTTKQTATKPRPEEIKKAILEIDRANAEFKKLRKKHGSLTEGQKEGYRKAAITLMEKRQALTALGVPFTHELTLVALESFRQKCNMDKSPELKYFLDKALTKQDYEKFLALDRQDAGKNIPDIKIDGASFGHPGYYFMKVPVQDEAHAARAACLGKLTNCCQSLSGEAGEPCAIHGLTSPNGGFYVLCKGNVNHPKVEDEVIAGSWVWRSKKNALVFDSIEVKNKEEQVTVKMVVDFYERAAKQLVMENDTDKVSCGAATFAGTSNLIGISSPVASKESFIDYTGYHDSEVQRLIFDRNQPFYGYGFDQDATELTEKLVTEIFESEGPLVKSIALQAMLNYSMMQIDDYEFCLLSELPNNDPQYAEIGKIYLSKGYNLCFKSDLESGIFPSDGVLDTVYVAPGKVFFYDDDGCRSYYSGRFFAFQMDDLASKINDPLFKEQLLLNLEESFKVSYMPPSIKSLSSTQARYLVRDNMGVLTEGMLDLDMTDFESKLGDEDFKKAILAVTSARSHTTKNENKQVFLDLIMRVAAENNRGSELGDILYALSQFYSGGFSGEDCLKSIAEHKLFSSAMNKEGDSVLIYLTKAGKVDILEKIIEKIEEIALDVFDFQNSKGKTVLMCLAEKENEALFEKLIQKGINIDLQDKEGKSALIHIVEKRNIPILKKILVSKPNLELADQSGQTALMIAAKLGFNEVVSMLLDTSVNINFQYFTGETALIKAVQNGHLEVVLTLISRGGATRKMSSEVWHKSPLMFAMEHDYPKIVLALIKNGADPHEENVFFKNTITWAAEKGYVEVVEAIKEQDLLQQQTLPSFTPLQAPTPTYSPLALTAKPEPKDKSEGVSNNQNNDLNSFNPPSLS